MSKAACSSNGAITSHGRRRSPHTVRAYLAAANRLPSESA